MGVNAWVLAISPKIRLTLPYVLCIRRMLEVFCLHMVSGLCRVVELAVATLSSVCMVGMSWYVTQKQTITFDENGEHQQYHDTWHMTHDSASVVLLLCLRGDLFFSSSSGTFHACLKDVSGGFKIYPRGISVLFC